MTWDSTTDRLLATPVETAAKIIRDEPFEAEVFIPFQLVTE